MTLRTLRGVTVVPSEAVQSGQAGQFVFVVKPDQTVDNRMVKLGQSIDNQIVVESGIAPGDTVVTDGQLRLDARRSGARGSIGQRQPPHLLRRRGAS